MIKLEKVRDLDIDVGSASRSLHLSAASGLQCLGTALYVIADDELHLGVFPVAGSGRGRLIRLFDGELPETKGDRKKRKPDLEALTFLPPFCDLSYGALFAIGSGSRPNRKKGVLLGLDAQGAISTPPKNVDLSFILDPLAGEFGELNIEGAVVVGEELLLLQRGNKRRNDNAIARYPLRAVLNALSNDQVDPLGPSAVDRFDLGAIQGTPFGFTDAAALSNGDMVFSAVAENTENAYLDGPCLGAGIGIVDERGILVAFDLLEYPHKIEGIHATEGDGAVELLLVTDADNPEIPASLFSTQIAR
ncbi:hypothetical protein ASD01_19045 [Ensifer sp. Root423]|uniref:DUF6929 family protein n=1 Tax=unclassified Ensifer TaxID=2633371 RepID=UPI000714F767|nr:MULTISPECIES: hypothetical protein [unclassified Ensifer]KQX31587.1 hypothetical protein ASD01_19045 [Ensifer sp. Root423]KQX52338.1 hypothetical protein ASD49_30945 [Ensifer sp. Root1298]KQX85540.1 hypothetical protein ASD41_30315 [Ensifer sp. Root1312]KRC24562.1 hypothetical protein ASE29_26550 [Ensifer sp. Root74]KRD76200.1 hypothetical protein ASE71_03610 [Ensifer sp. Root954]